MKRLGIACLLSIFLMTATPQGGYTLVKKEDNR